MPELQKSAVSPPLQGTSLANVKHVFQGSLALNETGWFGDFVGTVAEGGSYLLGGAPGSRKSGLAAQIALDLAKQDKTVLIIPTEEPPGRIGERCARLMTNWEAVEIASGCANVCIEHQV